MNEMPMLDLRQAEESWSVGDSPAAEDDRAALQASGLFDAAWYRATYPDIAALDGLTHFCAHGWKEGRRPNAYFATDWYLRENQDVQRSGANPVLHYLRFGEAGGRAPAPFFDLVWYRTVHQAAVGETLLAHFLARRLSGEVSPLPEFDPVYYLTTYPDIAAAGVDPFEHYLFWGYREGRNPSAKFDTRYYQRRYLDGELEENPLLHYRQVRNVLKVHPMPSASETGVFAAVRQFSRAGPQFEAFRPLPLHVRRQAKLLAYYLPQFHPIAENNAWWGQGFTEWTAIARGMPRFAGHYQPRTPRDLGHYSLDDSETMRAQIAMARDAGLFGFVHYFYWFNGHRLLERPIEAMLADASLDFPFCLMWANENWTRRWDGSEDQVLISQDWREQDETALVDCFARHFRDPRYIRLQGRPLLMIYRPALIPNTAATVARWRRLFRDRHGEEPILTMSQSFNATDPHAFGMDAAIEFPPHKLVGGLPLQNNGLVYYDPEASAQVYAYDDVAVASLAEPVPAYPLVKTIVPSWDNDARRQGAGLVVHGSTPAKYGAWLAALVVRAQEHRFFGEPIVCINAWNEWAEGAYLEPDVYFGAAYLNATARAVCATQPASTGVLLVGHDAFAAGAQMLLLALGRALVRRLGVQLEFLLLGDGVLRPDYEAVAPTTVRAVQDLPGFLAGCVGRGIGAAVVNSAASAGAVVHLQRAGIASLLLVHELPRMIASHALQPVLAQAVPLVHQVVFAAPAVRDGVAGLLPLEAGRTAIMPQGCYLGNGFSGRARQRLRARLGLPVGCRVVLGAGYADLRKGFDLFLQTWRAARRRDKQVVFCWIGDMDAGLRAHLEGELSAAIATGTFLLPGHQADASDWYSAADAFALTSREDPFPSVVLEAMSAGLPTVAFLGSGGIPEMLNRLGAGLAVPMAETESMARQMLTLLRGASLAGDRPRLAALARRHFDFDRYAETLLGAALPKLARISVVVPSYNYARYLPGRLASIFSQTYPVAEVIVLDDASTDDSAAVASATAAAWQREIRLVSNGRNSGSVFRQWRRGVELARGDYVWIAEADDEADPSLLATLASQLDAAPEVDLVLCDSRSIDARGAPVWPNYQGYFAEAGVDLSRDAIFPAREFARRFLAERNLILNASAVLWRRSALHAALERGWDVLRGLRLAGDWQLYLEVLTHSDGHVAWVAAPLNVHRRHGGSVTGALAGRRHLEEIARVQARARESLGLDAAAIARQEQYLAEVARDVLGDGVA